MGDERDQDRCWSDNFGEELEAIAVNMAKWPYGRLIKETAEVKAHFAPLVAGNPVEEPLLERRVAEWLYHFAHEHRRPPEECEGLLNAILAHEEDVRSNIDFMGAFVRLCLAEGDPTRGLRYAERALSLLASVPPDYEDHARQLRTLSELARLCRAALGGESTQGQ